MRKGEISTLSYDELKVIQKISIVEHPLTVQKIQPYRINKETKHYLKSYSDEDILSIGTDYIKWLMGFMKAYYEDEVLQNEIGVI